MFEKLMTLILQFFKNKQNLQNSLNMNQISEIMNQSQKSNFNIIQDKNEEYASLLKSPNDNQLSKDLKIQEGSYEELSKLLEKQDLAK